MTVNCPTCGMLAGADGLYESWRELLEHITAVHPHLVRGYSPRTDRGFDIRMDRAIRLDRAVFSFYGCACGFGGEHIPMVHHLMDASRTAGLKEHFAEARLLGSVQPEPPRDGFSPPQLGSVMREKSVDRAGWFLKHPRAPGAALWRRDP